MRGKRSCLCTNCTTGTCLGRGQGKGRVLDCPWLDWLSAFGHSLDSRCCALPALACLFTCGVICSRSVGTAANLVFDYLTGPNCFYTFCLVFIVTDFIASEQLVTAKIKNNANRIWYNFSKMQSSSSPSVVKFVRGRSAYAAQAMPKFVSDLVLMLSVHKYYYLRLVSTGLCCWTGIVRPTRFL